MKHPASSPFTLIPLFILLFCRYTSAHPGIGIVCDQQSGNIFYTDLKNVYKITPDGRETVAVANVHTHELALDGAGNLYGAHLWYTGERDNRWRQYIWQYSADGVLRTHVPEGEAFTMNFSLVRDTQFNAYSWRKEGEAVLFEKQTPEGKTTPIGKRAFKDIGWLKAGPDGTLFFNDEDDLWRLTPAGEFSIIANNLYSAKNPFSIFKNKHSIFGIWPDSIQNIYVAVHSGGCIKKIDAQGRATTVFESPLGWSPVGGLFDKKGCMWVLESTFTGQMRARKATPVCKGVVTNSFPGYGGRVGVSLLLFAGIVLLVFRILVRRKRGNVTFAGETTP